MKHLHCRDAGFDCDEDITGATDEEVLQKAAAHVGEKHPELTIDEATQAKLKSLIHDAH